MHTASYHLYVMVQRSVEVPFLPVRESDLFKITISIIISQLFIYFILFFLPLIMSGNILHYIKHLFKCEG